MLIVYLRPLEVLMLAALLLPVALAGPLCGLPQRGPPPPLRVPAHAPAPPDAALADRDPYDLPNSLSTAHFTARWGGDGGVDGAAVGAVLDAFETAWTTEITEMDQPVPTGADAWRFNIYIGDTGDGAPSGEGAGGYYDVDPEGYPMVVVAASTLDDPEFAEITAAHEFYHAIQATLDTYAYAGVGAWYWESTAVWMSGEVFPDNADYAVFLFGYAFLPYLPLGTFDYPDTGALPEYHQYGAFIFPRYLSEQVAGWSIIRDSWVVGGADDPLVVLDGLLAEDGTDLATTFTSFSAHNAVWDYADRSVYEDNLSTYESWFADEDARVVATLPSGGSSDWTTPPPLTLPQRFGYNVLEMQSPRAGTLTVDFAGDAAGSAGSAPAFGVTVTVSRLGQTDYQTIPLTEGSGTLDVALEGDEASLDLVVAAWSEALVADETFGYRIRTQLAPPERDTGDNLSSGGPLADKPTGCACGTTSARAGWVLTLLAAAISLRRRPLRRA